MEQRRQRLVMAVGAAVLLFILALPLWGYITTFVMPPRQVVASVNGETITLGDVFQRLQVLLRGSEVGGTRLNLAQDPFNLMNTMVENEVIEQMAPELGVHVTEREVDEEVRQRVVGSDTGEEADTSYQEQLRQYLNLIQLDEPQYRDLVRADLLREKAKEEVGKKISRVQAQVHLFRVNVADQEAVDRVRQLFEEGTSFEQLVDEYEATDQGVESDGEIGWVTRGQVGKQAAQIVFNLEPGTLSKAGQNQDGTFSMFMVKEKAEARELSDRQLETLQRQALQDWLTTQRGKMEITTDFGSSEYDWLVQQVRGAARPYITPVQGQQR